MDAILLTVVEEGSPQCARRSNQSCLEPVQGCNRERIILNSCWICFCDLNPHLAAFVMKESVSHSVMLDSL